MVGENFRANTNQSQFCYLVRWLERMRQGGTWGDTAMLLCLGCAFDLDIYVLIHDQPAPALVGASCCGAQDAEILVTFSEIKSCHIINGHVKSCHVMSCQIISNHVMSDHVKSCHVESYQVMSCHAKSCRVMPCHAMSCMPCHAMSCHVMPCHVMSCNVMKCHVRMILMPP